jgi:RimJ/RimL family protein N-acetyltransferase
MKLFTTRLILRELQQDDFNAVQEMESDPEVIRFEHALQSAEEIQNRFDLMVRDQFSGPRFGYRFAVTIRPEHHLCGRVSLILTNPAIHEWEIGWTMRRQEWGKGYAPEAAGAVLRFAFSELKAHRVVAFCHAENSASTRVMEKLGMQREGRLRKVRWLDEKWNDEYLYGILEEEFAPN